MSASELPNEGEYKFLIIENENVHKWGAGENKSYNMSMYKQQIKDIGIKNNDLIDFKDGPWNVTFDPNTKELVLFGGFD